MQIKNIDGSITDTDTNKTYFPEESKSESQIDQDDNIDISQEEVEIAKDPYEQWKLVEDLINMSSWELKYRFGTDDIRYIINELYYDEIYEKVKGKDKEELFNQGDIVKLSIKDEVLSNVYWVIIDIKINDNGTVSLLCMSCTSNNKKNIITRNTKSVKLYGTPIKINIDSIEEYIGHAKYIKLGW